MQVTGKGSVPTVPEQYRPWRVHTKGKVGYRLIGRSFEGWATARNWFVPIVLQLSAPQIKGPKNTPGTSAMCVVRTQGCSLYWPGSLDGKDGVGGAYPGICCWKTRRKTSPQALWIDLGSICLHPSQPCSSKDLYTAVIQKLTCLMN